MIFGSSAPREAALAASLKQKCSFKMFWVMGPVQKCAGQQDIKVPMPNASFGYIFNGFLRMFLNFWLKSTHFDLFWLLTLPRSIEESCFKVLIKSEVALAVAYLILTSKLDVLWGGCAWS